MTGHQPFETNFRNQHGIHVATGGGVGALNFDDLMLHGKNSEVRPKPQDLHNVRRG